MRGQTRIRPEQVRVTSARPKANRSSATCPRCCRRGTTTRYFQFPGRVRIDSRMGDPSTAGTAGFLKRTESMRTIFTMRQVATICQVAPRTVMKWFDSGRLRGYRIPGTQDRRIPREHLIRFLKEHGMPLGELEDEDK